MVNNKIWMGTKESDILYTNGFFSASITACGDGKNYNYSFSKETNHRINYNAANNQYTKYILDKLADILKNNPETEIMYYNPYYAHFLNSDMKQHVCCLNEKFVLDILRSKCEMRIMASEHIPVVPFSKVLGKDILKTDRCNNETYVVQENISSGGDGTYIISDRLSDFSIYDDEIYLVSHYYEKNIPVNINLIIFDDDIIIFPPSVQIVQRVENKLLFMGSDYYINKFREYFSLSELYNNTLKLAQALKAIGYRGICGFDFLAVKKQLLFLECNPRFQASSFLINKALENIGFPSLQEMNYMAFQHQRAPEFDFKSLKIPFSCVAYTYHSFLKNSLFRPEWYGAQNVVEILKDGFDPKTEFEDNSYLYRLVFSESITDITPEGTLNVYDNLLPASEKWYSKVMESDILAVKISLLNQGIYIPRNTIEYLKKLDGIKEAVFDSIDIILDNKMIINCPYKINYADFSPFSIEIKNGQLALYYYGNFLKPIALEKTDPDRNRLTKTSRVPYRRLSYMGGDRLRIHHTDICIFKKTGKPCKFCNLPTEKFKYSFEDIYEVLDFYLREKSFRHILIGGGSENQEQEYLTILHIVRYIRNRTNMPIYVMCLPIDDEKRLEELYDAGVTEIGFNLEIWTDNTATKIMPGKGYILRKKYLDALKKARKIWNSKYAVRSLLILGLERQNILSESIRALCSEGIMPILSVFRPLPGTEMSNVLPPSNEYLYDTYIMLDQICRDYDQHLGPDCISCQNNTLALPW